MIEAGEADDKIVAVVENEYAWGDARDLRDIPAVLVERLQHYFLAYKLVPGSRARERTRIAKVYGHTHAQRVVRAAMADYAEAFPSPDAMRDV